LRRLFRYPVRLFRQTRQDAPVDDHLQPAAARSSSVLVGALCGTGAALGWAAGFVAAKHGVSVGFAPADLAFHRFYWSGLLLIPLALRAGAIELGGIGWGRGLILTVLSGPLQAMLAYTGFVLVPLGHGTTIQPACAALFGLILATLVLRERPTMSRLAGGAVIVADGRRDPALGVAGVALFGRRLGQHDDRPGGGEIGRRPQRGDAAADDQKVTL